MDQRPWYERLFDRDNSAAPIVVLVLLVLAIVLVLVIAPMLQSRIEGLAPTRPSPVAVFQPQAQLDPAH